MRIRLLHPAVMLVYYMGLMIFIFMFTHPLYRSVLTLGILLLACLFNGWRKTLASLRIIGPMVLFFGILNPLFVHRGATILFYLFGNPITMEAAAYGLHNASLMLCVLLFFVSFNRVIDQSAFMFLTARWVPRTAFMTDMALRAASRFRARITEFIGVQSTRGISLTDGGLLTRLKAALTLLRAFTVRSLEEGMETAEVLKARDYGTVRRSAYRSYVFCARDRWGLLVVFTLCMPIFIGYVQGAGRYLFYPRLQNLSLQPGEGIVYMLFAIYIALPILYEGSGLIIRSRHHYAH